MRIRRKPNRNPIFLIAMLLIVSGCAHFKPDNSPEALEAVVVKVWEARKQKKWGDVYDAADLKFQENKKREEYTSKMEVLDFEIRKVTIEPDGLTGASLVGFDTLHTGRQIKVSVKEVYLFEKGRWRLKLSDPVNPFLQQATSGGKG